jgi:hypothetical protein
LSLQPYFLGGLKQISTSRRFLPQVSRKARGTGLALAQPSCQWRAGFCVVAKAGDSPGENTLYEKAIQTSVEGMEKHQPMCPVDEKKLGQALKLRVVFLFFVPGEKAALFGLLRRQLLTHFLSNSSQPSCRRLA